MIAPLTIDLKTLLSQEMIERLQAKAKDEHTPVENLVREAIEMYLDDEPEYEDTPNEEILAGIREGMRDALLGRTRPIEELFAELDQELAEQNADED